MTRAFSIALTFALSVLPALAQPVGPPDITRIQWNPGSSSTYKVYGKGSPHTAGQQVRLFKKGNPDTQIPGATNVGPPPNYRFTFTVGTNQAGVGDEIYAVVVGLASTEVEIGACGLQKRGISFSPFNLMAPELFAAAPAVSGQMFTPQTTGGDLTLMPGDLYVSLQTDNTIFLPSGAPVYLDIDTLVLLASFVTDATGAMQLPLQVPVSLPLGLTARLQAIVFDPVAPLLFHATTNALDVTIL